MDLVGRKTENAPLLSTLLLYAQCPALLESRLWRCGVIPIGQKQLQIFRQKKVGSDILLYRPAPSYE
jgi:hypothetical protein